VVGIACGSTTIFNKKFVANFIKQSLFLKKICKKWKYVVVGVCVKIETTWGLKGKVYMCVEPLE
jgi:hypothetical protein